MTELKQKRPIGRPRITVDDLQPDWKEVILSLAMEGASDCEIRAALVVKNGKFSHDLWYVLEKREQEFSEILKKAKVMAQAWWEKQGRINLKEDKFNHVLWYMNMKNRFRSEWNDQRPVQKEDEDIKDRGLELYEPPNGRLKQIQRFMQ